MAFNWGALVGYLSVSGIAYYNPYITLPLYFAGIAWTIVYDTIYAHQDKLDDKKVGVFSTALLFGDRTRSILLAFVALFTFFMFLAGYYGANYDLKRHASYYIALAFSTLHLVHQVTSVNLSNPADCANKFRSNKYIGMLMLAGIILSNFGKQQDVGKMLKKQQELSEIGAHSPGHVVQLDEDVERVFDMYKEAKENNKLTVLEKIQVAIRKLF